MNLFKLGTPSSAPVFTVSDEADAREDEAGVYDFVRSIRDGFASFDAVECRAAAALLRERVDVGDYAVFGGRPGAIVAYDEAFGQLVFESGFWAEFCSSVPFEGVAVEMELERGSWTVVCGVPIAGLLVPEQCSFSGDSRFLHLDSAVVREDAWIDLPSAIRFAEDPAETLLVSTALRDAVAAHPKGGGVGFQTVPVEFASA